MTHLFLSPHADDAVLSCGGLMYDLAQAGETVEVFTLMAADAPAPLPRSPLVERLHRRWALEDNPYHVRRTEDRQAVQHLGGAAHWGDWQDCIYRVNTDGQTLYPTEDHLFGPVHTHDPLKDATLSLAYWPRIAAIYVPLAAGQHVDHQVVRAAALKHSKTLPPSVAVFLYEEYPYSAESGEIRRSFDGEKPRLWGTAAVEAALRTLPGSVLPQMRLISEAALQAKVEAIACYRSQISTFWDGLDEMAQSVRDYVRAVGNSGGLPYAERLWVLTNE